MLIGKEMGTRQHMHQFLVSREFGGAGEIALGLAQYCKESLLQDVQVWVPGEGRAAEHVRAIGLPLATYDLGGAYSPSAFRAIKANLSLAWQLRTAGSGIVHVHDPLVYGAIARGLRLTNFRHVVHVQIEHSAEGLRWALRRPPDVIVTCAQFLVDQVRRTLPPKLREVQRIVAIPNAIDTQRFAPGDKSAAKHRVGAIPDRPLVIMLANLAPHKGQETAILAVSELRRRGVSVQCWLAGVDRSEGKEYEKRLRRLVADLRVDDAVSFIGFRKDTPELLRASDLMLLPSTNEGLPLSILEAQATEVPVIAAPTAGIPEVISCGQTGFLVDANDAAGYAEKMDLLLRNFSLARTLSTRAAIHCRREYSWARFRQRMSEVYSEILAT